MKFQNSQSKNICYPAFRSKALAHGLKTQRGFQQESEKTTNFDRFGQKMIKRDEDKTQVRIIYLVRDKNDKSSFIINTPLC